MSKNIDHSNCCFELITINSQLEVIEHKTYCFPLDYEYLSVHTKKGNEKIVVTGCIVLPVNLVRVIAFKLSPQLDSLKCKILHDYPGVGADIKELSDGSYWVFVNFAIDYLKLDSDFNVLSSNPLPITIASPYGIKWNTDTSFYLAGQLSTDSGFDIGSLRQYSIYVSTITPKERDFAGCGSEDF